MTTKQCGLKSWNEFLDQGEWWRKRDGHKLIKNMSPAYRSESAEYLEQNAVRLCREWYGGNVFWGSKEDQREECEMLIKSFPLYLALTAERKLRANPGLKVFRGSPERLTTLLIENNLVSDGVAVDEDVKVIVARTVLYPQPNSILMLASEKEFNEWFTEVDYDD